MDVITRIYNTLSNLLAPACLAFSIMALPAVAEGPPELWLEVDSQTQALRVMRGEAPVKIFGNIAIGSNGTTWDKVMGDEKTPKGTFHISEIRPSQKFGLFMAIDYPNWDHTMRAWMNDRIPEEEFLLLKGALDNGKPVPQTTTLGGYLGIHGLGSGSTGIHQIMNWTDGCVALTNEEVEELANIVKVGTAVVIR